MSRAGDLLLQPVRDSIRRHAVQAAAERVEVVPAVFIERAELMGSLALALRAWNPALASPRTGEVAAARRAQAGGSESLT